MKKIFKKTGILLLTGVLFLSAGCEMDTVNPNAPTESEVLTTRDGIIALSVGVRQFYSTSGIEAAYLYTGITSREMKGVATYTNVLELEAGGTAIPTNNASILNLWTRMQRVMSMSDDIIDNAPNVSTLNGGMLSGIVAHAELFKAIALAELASAFEQVNLETSTTEPVVFVPREQVMTEVIRLLNDAITRITVTPPSTEFATAVTGTAFDLKNVLYAYRARYNLMAGHYADALSDAKSVDLSRKNEFVYSTQSLNPVYNAVFTLKYYFPRDHFGLPSGLYESGDKRYDFYFTTPDATVNGDVTKTLKGFFSEQTGSIPVYMPDEMKLIEAESILRTNGSLSDALALINEVRTQNSGDIFGVNAGLPAYNGVVTTDGLLLEVYKQRCAELYLTGLKWEDTRRFNRPVPPDDTSERNRIFYPYPDQERLNNPNTPPDPSI